MLQPIKVDLHIHTTFSDGKFSVDEIVDFYGRRGFGAIAITDHLCETNNLVGKVSHQLNYSLTRLSFDYYMETIERAGKRALGKYNMRVIPGYEITKNSFINHRSAHMLILGTQEFIDPNQSIDKILEEATRLKAFKIAAHPFFTGDFEFQTFHLWSRRDELQTKIDAWEVNYRKNICSDVLKSGLPLIASSDFHHALHAVSWKTKLYCANEQTDIFNAIRYQHLDFYLDQDVHH